ncbi:MAG: 16S rRNA (guanine(527)-N(7))-methyltransferase RsmG [Mesorhizobium sp.]
MSEDRYLQLCRVAGDVSRETYNRLEWFETEFRRWNARINLAAESTLPELWSRHILDSAQLLPLARGQLAWLDLGSGGGFPGAIMAILLAETPGSGVTLVESNRKKAAFLQTVLAQNKAPARVVALRIDAAVGQVATPDIVTARALAALDQLLDLSSPWLLSGARGLFHKGRDYQAEVANSRVVWDFDLIEHPSKIDEDSVVLEISNLARKTAVAGE